MSKNTEFLNDPCVKAWLSKITAKRTVENYKSTFPKWLEFIQMSPSEQIEKRLQDLISTNPQTRAFFEDKVIEYKNSLISQYSPSSVRIYLTSVLSFFSKNRVKLQFSKGDLKIESTQKVIHTWTPNNEETRAVYHFLDSARDRAILLLMYHSGFNSVDVRNLNIEDLPPMKEDEHSFIEKLREKTDELVKTCISLECVHELQVYLHQRAELNQKAPLFVTHKNNRIDNRTINEVMEQAVAKAHPTRLKEWKTKNLRSSYNDALLRANLTQEVKDLMMGHKREGARGHYECSEITIREAYEKAFKYLSINGGAQARKDLERVEKTLTTLTDIISKQQRQLEILKSEMETINKERLAEIEEIAEFRKAMKELKQQP